MEWVHGVHSGGRGGVLGKARSSVAAATRDGSS
jgi:hypothetical protein